MIDGPERNEAGPKTRLEECVVPGGLPGARIARGPAGRLRAATLASRGALTRRSATRGLDDLEVVARLRVGVDGVTVGGGRDDRHRALAGVRATNRGRDVQTGGAELGRRVTRHVRLRVGEARLDLAHHVASIRLG